MTQANRAPIIADLVWLLTLLIYLLVLCAREREPMSPYPFDSGEKEFFTQ